MSIENRLAAKKRSKQAKKKRIRNKIVKVVVVLALLAVAVLIGFSIYNGSIKKDADKNHKADRYILADGTVDIDGKALDYVKVSDYKNITVKREDNLPTKTEVQNQVNSFVNSNKTTIATAGEAIAEEDEVVLTYKVVVEGKEVESLNAKEKTYGLGTAAISKDFDKAIAAKKVGDQFSVDVKYDADEKNENLAGKTATYAGKIEKVIKKPELTDALVEEKMGKELGKDFPHTVDGLWQYYGDKSYKANVDKVIRTAIVKGTKMKKSGFIFKSNKYPKKYLLNEYYVQKDITENYISMYMQYGIFTSKYQAMDVAENDDTAYDKALDKFANKQAKKATKEVLAYQAIYEDAKLAKVDEAALKAFVAENMNGQEYENYSKKAIAQEVLQNNVVEHVKSLAKYEGDEKLFWVEDPKEEAKEE